MPDCGKFEGVRARLLSIAPPCPELAAGAVNSVARCHFGMISGSWGRYDNGVSMSNQLQPCLPGTYNYSELGSSHDP